MYNDDDDEEYEIGVWCIQSTATTAIATAKKEN